MRKFRIVERSLPEGRIFVIQTQRRFIPWIWQDVWKVYGAQVKDYFDTYGEAIEKMEVLKKFRVKGDVEVSRFSEGIKDYTKHVSFWKRLDSFIDQVHVHDLPGMEEKDMIQNICSRKIKELDI